MCSSLAKGSKLGVSLQIMEELTGLGVESSAIEGILAATSLGSVEELQQLLGSDNEAVQVRRPIQATLEVTPTKSHS